MAFRQRLRVRNVQLGQPDEDLAFAPAVAGACEARPFRYRDLGSMAYLSRGHAVVSFRRLKVSGFVGWLMWLVFHIAFLTGYMNRMSALFATDLRFGNRPLC
ncbi:MAG: hypothetical protein ABI401_04880 [Candidatus Dormibacter sp.]